MERLKAWLQQQGISIVYPGIGTGGLVTLRLHPPSGADFEVAFYPDDLEADPEDAIEFIKNLLAHRRLSL